MSDTTIIAPLSLTDAIEIPTEVAAEPNPFAPSNELLAAANALAEQFGLRVVTNRKFFSITNRPLNAAEETPHEDRRRKYATEEERIKAQKANAKRRADEQKELIRLGREAKAKAAQESANA